MTPITGLRADLIPHLQWPQRRWYQASPLWYYHGPTAPASPRLDERFYHLIDPDLRALCRHLHAAHLRTTPSCQGHFYPRRQFEQIWRELLQEQKLIQTMGLVVHDSESGADRLFRDPEYALPWEDFESFYAQAAAQQGTGYLGIVAPPDAVDLVKELRSLAEESAWPARALEVRSAGSLDAPLLNIMVRADSALEQSRHWAAITHRLMCLTQPVGVSAESYQ